MFLLSNVSDLQDTAEHALMKIDMLQRKYGLVTTINIVCGDGSGVVWLIVIIVISKVRQSASMALHSCPSISKCYR